MMQWRREPDVTRRAKALAAEHGYGLHESLTAARKRLVDERNQTALAAHLTTLLAAHHNDPNLANILVAAIPGDQLAAEVAKLVDITGWARMVLADLQPPTTGADITGHDHPDDEADPDDDPVALSSELPAALLKEIPSKAEEYGRWHQLWTLIRDDTAGNTTLADRHGVSQRTVQRIRKAGELGLLDSPIPLIARLLPQARKVAKRANGHQPETRDDTAP